MVMKKIVFFSPHYDDAVGSCGGLISHLVKRGHHVEIRTVFSGDAVIPFNDFAIELHKLMKLEHMDNPVLQRQHEEQSVGGHMGVAIGGMGYADSIYRRDREGRSLHDSHSKLFKNIAEHETEILDDICGKVVHSEAGDILFFPAAVGGHVDHKIVHEAGLKLLKQHHLPVLFYHEFYYTPESYYPPALAQLQRHVFNLSEELLQKKFNAFLHYKSQIGLLFETEGELLSHFRNQADHPHAPGIETYFGEKNLWQKMVQ